MARIFEGRMTVQRTQGLVVFLIGMRINQWWKVHQWLPVMLAMPRMLRELQRRPDAGLLGMRFSSGLLVQYWESTEKLLAYAHDKSGEHFPAWARFNQLVKGSAVGIWHETFVVSDGHFECIYVNMPSMGLGRFAELVPARGKLSRAAGRLHA